MSESILVFLIIILSVIGIPVIFGLIAEYLERKHELDKIKLEKGIYASNKPTISKIDIKNIFLTKFFEVLSTLIIIFIVYLLFDIFDVGTNIKNIIIDAI